MTVSCGTLDARCRGIGLREHRPKFDTKPLWGSRMTFLIIAVAIVAWGLFAYNRLTSRRNQADSQSRAKANRSRSKLSSRNSRKGRA